MPERTLRGSSLWKSIQASSITGSPALVRGPSRATATVSEDCANRAVSRAAMGRSLQHAGCPHYAFGGCLATDRLSRRLLQTILKRREWSRAKDTGIAAIVSPRLILRTDRFLARTGHFSFALITLLQHVARRRLPCYHEPSLRTMVWLPSAREGRSAF